MGEIMIFLQCDPHFLIKKMVKFAKFAKKVGKDKTAILMHTAANDPEGQDLHAVAKKLDIQECLLLSEQRISPEQINIMYNCSDCVINLSNNEYNTYNDHKSFQYDSLSNTKQLTLF